MIDARTVANYRRYLQRRMPEGWTIKANFERHGHHHQFTNYVIKCGDVVLTIGGLGECEPPPGWTVQHMSGSFMSKTKITAPDGTNAMIDDGDLA